MYMPSGKVETQMSETLTLHADEELVEKLERFRQQQAFTPSKSAVIRKALEEYLDAQLENGNSDVA